MPQIPPRHRRPVPLQLLKTRRTPHRDFHPIFFAQNLPRPQRLEQNAPARTQMRLPSLTAQSVQPLQDAILRTCGHRRHRVALILHRQIVDQILVARAHPPQPLADNHRNLIAKGRIVGHHVRKTQRHQMALPVLMLQTFAVERSAPGGRADQKAPRHLVAGRPDQIRHPLKTEDRVEDEKGQRLQPVCGVGGASGDKRRQRPRFADPLFQELAIARLPVVG